jgi:hypothetical protein
VKPQLSLRKVHCLILFIGLKSLSSYIEKGYKSLKTYTIIYKTDKMEHFEMRTLTMKEFEKLMNLMDRRKGNIQILSFSIGSSQESLF